MCLNKDELNLCREVAPFITFGALGGFIKALNTKKCSWREIIVKILTGSFGGLVGGMWLMTTDYPLLAQYAMAGAIGVTVDAVYAALIHRLWIVIGGTEPEDGQEYSLEGNKEQNERQED